MEGHSCRSRAGPGSLAVTLQLSSILLSPEQHNQLLVLVHIYSPCHMADFQKTSQQQSLLWSKINSSQINGTKGGEVSVHARAGELAHIVKNFMDNLSHAARWVQTKYDEANVPTHFS